MIQHFFNTLIPLMNKSAGSILRRNAFLRVKSLIAKCLL